MTDSQGNIEPVKRAPDPVDPGVRRGWGTTGDILFVSAGGYHHHLGFNTWKSKDGSPHRRGDRTASRRDRLSQPPSAGRSYRRLKAVDWPIRQTADDGTHEAIYITDPDGNDLELMWDRPAEQWRRDGQGRMSAQFGDELDLEELLREPD